MEFEKTYNPSAVEGKIYQKWQDGGYFKPEINPQGDPFCIIMPPPNANGALHIGHAVGVTLEDIMIRYARMQGKAALWLPGADHAGFETQVVFEKKLEKEGKSRFQMPKEQLYEEMWEFTQKNKKVMEDQLRKLGASCDWDREKFTGDKDINSIVYETFKKLYDDGLAYRALRLVNWCPKHQTSLSDLEVKSEERQDPIYYINYGPITIATTRPETMFADVAVAVNPNDKRYKDLVGTEIDLPLTLRTIPVIADEAVDMNFGTGAVKITPAHDPLDFEIGKRHGLDVFSILDDRGRIKLGFEPEVEEAVASTVEGLKVKEAREKVIELLDARHLVKEIDKNYRHVVGTCYKCGSVIEPMPKRQWYIAVNKTGKSGKNLAADALRAVNEGKVQFVTKRFEKTFKHWMNNIRDWNISRQIVWCVPIPAWYRKNEEFENDEEIYIGIERPKGDGWEKDPDVFDTWFSSGQWPFAALKTTKYPTDFKKFYPTDVMETAWDILFFWVARMIMLSLYVTDKVPFKKIYIHGLVRDKDRQKMSKSKGNVINPLGVAEEYGTDAVRMALVFGSSAGNDTVISEDKIRGMRNFANKLWNIARFILTNLDNSKTNLPVGEQNSKSVKQDFKAITPADKKILKKLNETVASVDKFFSTYRFSQAGEIIYDFTWHQFADIYLEESKIQMSNDKTKENTQAILIEVLSTILKLLHPIMPYVTEEIWSKLPEAEEMLIIASWPKKL